MRVTRAGGAAPAVPSPVDTEPQAWAVSTCRTSGMRRHADGGALPRAMPRARRPGRLPPSTRPQPDTVPVRFGLANRWKARRGRPGEAMSGRRVLTWAQAASTLPCLWDTWRREGRREEGTRTTKREGGRTENGERETAVNAAVSSRPRIPRETRGGRRRGLLPMGLPTHGITGGCSERFGPRRQWTSCTDAGALFSMAHAPAQAWGESGGSGKLRARFVTPELVPVCRYHKNGRYHRNVHWAEPYHV